MSDHTNKLFIDTAFLALCNARFDDERKAQRVADMLNQLTGIDPSSEPVKGMFAVGVYSNPTKFVPKTLYSLSRVCAVG